MEHPVTISARLSNERDTAKTAGAMEIKLSLISDPLG